MVGHKKALMSLWKDTFLVSEWHEITKPNGSTGFEEVNVLENQPCKLSFSTLDEVNQTEMTAAIVQTTKLFCDDALTIKAGSKIVIQRGGRTFEFSQSGEVGIFSSHQEIVLVPFRGWA